MQKIYVKVRMLTFYRPYTTLMQLSYLELVVVKTALFFNKILERIVTLLL